jgi:polyisoprenoid-binding protein YceI
MRQKNPLPLLLTLSALLVLPALSALAAVEKKGESSAAFTGKGPAGFKLEGKTQELKLQDDGQVLKVIVPLANLKTGIDLRDRHLREKYLEVQKYPDAVLEVPWASLQLPEDGKSTSGKGKGKMTLHGKTKEVSFSYTVQRSGNTYQVTGNTPLNVKDFDITIPSYMGVTVKPDIETVVSFTATKS